MQILQLSNIASVMNYSALCCVCHSPKFIKSWIMQKEEKDLTTEVSSLIRSVEDSAMT